MSGVLDEVHRVSAARGYLRSTAQARPNMVSPRIAHCASAPDDDRPARNMLDGNACHLARQAGHGLARPGRLSLPGCKTLEKAFQPTPAGGGDGGDGGEPARTAPCICGDGPCQDAGCVDTSTWCFGACVWREWNGEERCTWPACAEWVPLAKAPEDLDAWAAEVHWEEDGVRDPDPASDPSHTHLLTGRSISALPQQRPAWRKRRARRQRR